MLDEIQKVHSRIFKYFSAFSEIFPSAKNNILDALLEYVSFQVNQKKIPVMYLNSHPY